MRKRQEVEDVGIEDLPYAGRGEAVDLGCLTHGEMDRLHTLVQRDVEHGVLRPWTAPPPSPAGLQSGLHLVEVGLPAQQAHLLEVLGQVQVGGSEEVEDVANTLPSRSMKQLPLAVPLGGHLPREHGAQHGVRGSWSGLPVRLYRAPPTLSVDGQTWQEGWGVGK